MNRLNIFFLTALLVSQSFAQSALSQAAPAQIAPPGVSHAKAPPPDASAAELEKAGDQLRSEKAYLDALDYYKVALTKSLNRSSSLNNKAGMALLQSERFKESEKYFQRALKLDSKYAAAYNNLGAAYYEQKKYGKAIKEYERAIKLEPTSASYYSNIGAAYFSKKDWVKASEAYEKAVQLDPNIFDETSRYGIAARMSSPDDRAYFQYVLAKLYAKNGDADRALQCLRRAMESGYPKIDNALKDEEFAALRKDPRFTELMNNRPAAIPN